MTAQIIDGKLIAQQVRDEVAANVANASRRESPNRYWQLYWSVTARIRRHTLLLKEKHAKN